MIRKPSGPARVAPHYKPPTPKPAPAPPPEVPAPPLPGAAIVSLGDFAGIMGLHVDQVRAVGKAGFVQKVRPGYVRLGEACRGVVNYYKSKVYDAQRNASRNRTADARTEEIMLRLAEKKRELIPKDDVLLAFDTVLAAVREEFNGLGAKATRDVVLKRKIDLEVNASFARIAKALEVSMKLVETGNDPPGGGGDYAP